MVTYHFDHIRNMHLSWFWANDAKISFLVLAMFVVAMVVATKTDPRGSLKKATTSNFFTLIAISCVGYLLVNIMLVVTGVVNPPDVRDNVTMVSNGFNSQFEHSYPNYDKSSVENIPLAYFDPDKQDKSFILHNSKTNQDEACKLVFANGSKNFQQVMETNDSNLPEYSNATVTAELVCNAGTSHVVQPVK